MDDLDLEQLKQELHDVSDDNRYDVDEIMREVGADAGPEPEGLEELMKSLGVAVAEKPDVDATQPIAAEEPELSGDMDGLQRATEQTQALAEEQAALAEDAAGAALESDPLEEQDSIFAQLFAQLGEIEQKEEPQPETEPVLELEEEPDLMARLFPASEEDGMPAQEQPPEAPSAPVEQETPIHIRTEALTGTQERSDAPLDGSAAEQEAVSDIADDPDLFSRWSAAPEPPEAQTDETFVETKVREAQTQEEEAAVSMEPEETPEEDAPELMDEEPEKQPEPPQKKAKKSIFARWFGASQQPDGEEQAVEAAEPEGLASHETQLLDALEEHTAQQVDAAPEEQLTQRIDSEPELAEEPQPKGSFLDRMMDVFGLEIVEEEIDEPQAEDAPEQPAEAQPQEAEPQAETQPEADAQLPEEEQPDEQQPVEEQRMEDPAEADFRETLRREEEIDTIEDTPEPPQPRPEDTPVISEEELEEFLSDIEAEEEPEHASFEQLLRDSGVETEQSSKLVLPEEFPDEETTVYVDIPVAKAARAAEERTQPPELFDAAAELEKAQVERELAEPEHDPDWLGLSMEELCREVPPLEELRAEGPVMAHEVIRQKEWIMGRIRSYKEELLRA
ncbi:MAG: hypothetical protein Q4D42_06470, partial [Eubacteriales bacterium]|nr:hypothetical protein [Eubacteriales bacterium]